MRRNLPAFLVSVLCVCVCALALVFSACDSGGGGGGGGGGSSSPASLKVPLPGGARAAGPNLWERADTAYFKVSISSSRYKASKTGTLGGVVEFSNIPVGDYTVTIEGKDENGNSVSRGSKTASVKVGVTSSVAVDLGYLEYCTVTFLAPSGSNIQMDPMKVTVGEKFKLPECAFFAPQDKVFSSWGLASGEPFGAAGTLHELSEDISLSPIWDDVPIVYDANRPFSGTIAQLRAATFGTDSSATNPYSVTVTDAYFDVQDDTDHGFNEVDRILTEKGIFYDLYFSHYEAMVFYISNLLVNPNMVSLHFTYEYFNSIKPEVITCPTYIPAGTWKCRIDANNTITVSSGNPVTADTFNSYPSCSSHVWRKQNP